MPTLSGLGILPQYRLQQLVPGQYRIHLGKKSLFTGRLLLMLIGAGPKNSLGSWALPGSFTFVYDLMV